MPPHVQSLKRGTGRGHDGWAMYILGWKQMQGSEKQHSRGAALESTVRKVFLEEAAFKLGHGETH